MLDDQAHGSDIAIDLPNDSAGRRRTSIYQPEQAGLIFPEMPEFASHAEAREYRKQHLVAACRAFALHGFDYGFAGTSRSAIRSVRSCTGPTRCACTSRRCGCRT